MHGFERNPLFEITDSDVSLKSIQDKDYYPEDLSKEIQNSGILLIPTESWKDYQGPLFPAHTTSFFRFLQENVLACKTSICITKESYRELELHGEFLNLASILVQDYFFQEIIKMIVSFTVEYTFRRRKSVNLHVDIHVEKHGETKKISYNGPTEDFEKTMKSINENIISG